MTRPAPASFDDLIPYLHSTASPQNLPRQAERDNEFADEFVQPGDDVACSEGDLDVPGVAWREEIQGFHGSVHEERWGTIARAVKNVHTVSVPLKACWNLDKFLGGRHAQAGSRAEGEFGHDVVAVDRDLSSHASWASLTIMLEIAAVQRHVADWANSCPCCGDLPLDGLPSDVSLRTKACPMTGRRSAEIASGDFLRLLKRLFQHHATVPESTLPRSLPHQDVLELMRDFEAARAHIVSAYVLNMSFWMQPPYVLAGIAHVDPRSVAQSLEACLNSPASAGAQMSHE